MSGATVLVVDPDGADRAETAGALRDGMGASVLEAQSLAGAGESLADRTVDAVVTEYDLGDGTGLDLARHVRSVSPDTGVVLYTDTADVDTGSAEDVIAEYVPKGTPGAADLLVTLVEQAGPERTQAAYPLPDDESERLAAIERYVDEGGALREPLDRITRLAAEHFGLEVSSVNVIGEHTQEFLSCHGASWASTDRDDSICTYTILEDDGVMSVEDVREDPRFADNDALPELGVRAYLGAGIESPDGHTVGTLCIYDDEPRSFSAADEAYLATLAALVGDLLELAGGGGET